MALPSNFPQANLNLVKPVGWTEEQCSDMKVYKDIITIPSGEDDKPPVYVSRILQYWKFNLEELNEINRTGGVWLQILGDPPPVSIFAENPFYKRETYTGKAYKHHIASDLQFYGKGNGAKLGSTIFLSFEDMINYMKVDGRDWAFAEMYLDKTPIVYEFGVDYMATILTDWSFLKPGVRIRNLWPLDISLPKHLNIRIPTKEDLKALSDNDKRNIYNDEKHYNKSFVATLNNFDQNIVRIHPLWVIVEDNQYKYQFQ